MLRYLTAGESHGQGLTVIVDGLPAGIELSLEAIDRDLARRQKGYGRGGRMSIEADHAAVLSGVRHGVTLGSPIAIAVPNRDAANWGRAMDPWGVAPAGVEQVTCPRPGHADLAGAQKFGHLDLRNVLERASARETAARVAAGALARAMLERFGIAIGSHVLRIGGAGLPHGAADAACGAPVPLPQTPGELQAWQETVDGSPVRCPSAQASRAMVEAIDRAVDAGHSLGGVFEVIAVGLPPGLGSYAQWDLRLDGRLAQALMSVPGVKGVEFGLGFGAADLPGSAAHDEMGHEGGRPARSTNRAGGLEGGMSNGEPLIARCAMKPIATQARPLKTLDLRTGAPALAHRERADTCAVPAAAVVGEAAVALVLADAVLEKFGGDSMPDVQNGLAAYRSRLGGV
jgi:chorismate synthase